ncbi:MAG: hypothetical protein ACLTTJ_05125 [Blautia sp.]
MFNFNEDAVRKEHENGLSIIGQTQEVVDQICKNGYKNIFILELEELSFTQDR